MSTRHLNVLALSVLLVLLLLEQLLNQSSLLLTFVAFPAAGWILGQINREIKNHILLHSVHLVSLFLTFLLAIYAAERGGSWGLLLFLLTFSPSFYWGMRQR